MTLLSIGDQVQPGVYRVHSRFRRAANYEGDSGFVSLVAPELGAGPVNLVVRDADPSRVERIVVDTERVILGERVFLRAAISVYASALKTDPGDFPGWRDGAEAFRKALVQFAPARSLVFTIEPAHRREFRPGFESLMADRLARGVQTIRRGEVEAGVSMLRGCGFGLTPSGDDFIAGMLAALHLQQTAVKIDLGDAIDRIHAAAAGGGALSRTFLRLARDGCFFERMKDLLYALLRGERGEIARRTRELMSVGATSGADSAVGLLEMLGKSGSVGVWGCGGGGTERERERRQAIAAVSCS